MTTMTWHEFINESKAFLKMAEQFGDPWSLYVKNDREGNSFLVYKQKLTHQMPDKNVNDQEDNTTTTVENNDPMMAVAALKTSNDLIELEYHIVYSISYQVPVFYFNASRRDGSLLGLEDCWRIFRSYNDDAMPLRSRDDMLSILTQFEHPVLFRPFLAIHPCRTSELLEQTVHSDNRVLTFISLMGPYVRLNLRNEYGLDVVKV